MIQNDSAEQVTPVAAPITRARAVVALSVLVLLLLVGTQMPGAWRDEAFRVTHLPWQMTKVAHFVLFTLMAAVACARPLRTPLARVLVGALFLALVTEGLQIFASNRDPSWLDVGIDMAGAVLGLKVLTWVRWFAQRETAK